MNQADWTAPPKSEPPPPKLHPWKLDEDPKSHFDSGIYIYEVPPHVPGIDSHIRRIAVCESRADAELIVSLYEKFRSAS